MTMQQTRVRQIEGREATGGANAPLAVVEAVHPPAHAMSPQAFPDSGASVPRGRRGPPWKIISFFLVAVIPSLLGILYFWLVAADQYVSEMRFGIRSAESASIQNASILRGLGVADQSGTDSFAIVQYIQSREIIDQLQSKIDLRKAFAHPDADFIARFNPARPIEDLVEYWKRQIDAYYETSTGTVVVRVRAFSRQDALAIANGVLTLSEQLVNDLSSRARRDSLKYSEAEVARAEERLLKAQVAMRELRDQEGILDPRKTAETTMTLIAKLRSELALAKTEMQSQKAYLSADSPVLNVMRTRIASLEGEIAKIQNEITAQAGSRPRNETLSRVIGAYENAEIERQFSEKYYSATLEMLQKARIDAERQQKYLATFIRPSLAEDALYPKRFRNSLTTLVLCFGAWMLGLLVASSIRDHM